MALILLLLSLVLSTVASGAEPPTGSPWAEREADSLYTHAIRALEHDDFDYRREGLHDLEEAVRLAPANANYRLALAQVYFAGGYFHAARKGYEEVARAESSAAYLDLGLLWRREWLQSNERASLDRSVDALMTAAWLEPMSADAWLLLVPLYLAQGQNEEAASAAFGALVADSKRLEAHLAVAATLCHLGVVGVGDSIFRATIPRLPPGLRARFEAAAPLPPDAPPPGAAAGVGPEGLAPGEADRLASWSWFTEQRVLLPGPTSTAETAADLRARFGAPTTLKGGQVGQRLKWGSGGPSDGPRPGTVWQYPDLGVRVGVMDWLLVFRPDLSESRARDAAALPSSALAAMYARILDVLGGAQPAKATETANAGASGGK